MPVSSTKYQSLRENVHPSLNSLPDAQLESVLSRHGIDAEMAEGFFDDLGKVASSIGSVALKAAPSILPMAGTLVGGAFGGPIGASLGGALGRAAGGAIGSATGAGAAPAAASGGGSAASQLLQTVTRPETLQALMSMVMGRAGNPNVTVGSTPVPVGAFSNLLGVLAGRAQSEYAEATAVAARAAPEYMTDYAGEAVGDPGVAGNRADALYGLLERQEASDRRSRVYEAAEAYPYEAADAEWAGEAESEAMELMDYLESFES